MRTDNMAADAWNQEQITKINQFHTWGFHNMFSWSFLLRIGFFKMIKKTLPTRCPLDCHPTQAWIMTAFYNHDPIMIDWWMVYSANVLTHYKICHISFISTWALLATVSCSLRPAANDYKENRSFPFTFYSCFGHRSWMTHMGPSGGRYKYFLFRQGQWERSQTPENGWQKQVRLHCSEW